MDKEIVLYGNGCPQCQILETKLNQKDMRYTHVTDVEIMTAKGFTRVPMLEVGNVIMDFPEAVKFVNHYRG